jgi:hypothetical protein
MHIPVFAPSTVSPTSSHAKYLEPMDPSRTSPRDSRQKTKAVDNRVTRTSTEGMDLDLPPPVIAGSGTLDVTELFATTKPVTNEEDMLLKLKEVNKVSSPLPDFMLTPKNKGSGRRNSLLVQHSPPNSGQIKSVSSFGS